MIGCAGIADLDPSLISAPNAGLSKASHIKKPRTSSVRGFEFSEAIRRLV